MQRLHDRDPRRLGGYRLSARIGTGGMGVVYLGRSRTGSRVAVKVIQPHLVDADARRRFRREVDAAIRVSSRYTARVLDADVEGDTPFLVTEYVAGATLAEHVADRGAMSGPAVVAVAAGVAAGLAGIHAAGVVHRDLSPCNVILTTDGPRIIDLGVAWVEDATTASQTASIIGTPAYLAPEVITGHAASAAADIFAWGALTYFMSTGDTPFGHGPAHAVMYRIVHDAPAIDGLPQALHHHVTAALSKAAHERPAAADLARQLVDSDARNIADVETAVATVVGHTQVVADNRQRHEHNTPRPPRRVRVLGALAAVAAVASAMWFATGADGRLGTAIANSGSTRQVDAPTASAAPATSPAPSASPSPDRQPTPGPAPPTRSRLAGANDAVRR